MMNILDQLNVGGKVASAILFDKRYPIGVGWNITYRCNLKCSYCGLWDMQVEELDTAAVFRIIDELYAIGVRFVNFSGGEPLLRRDLGAIIKKCLDKGFHVGIFSNGTLIANNIEAIRNLHEIQLSLDGPREFHDLIRGNGVYDKVIEAIEICLREGLKVNLSMVLTDGNTGHVPFVVDLAERYGVGVYFSPADQQLAGDTERLMSVNFNRLELQKTIDYLMLRKKRGCRAIRNSPDGLKYMSHWPNPTEISCLISRIFFNIEPDGRIFSCDQFPNFRNYLRPIDGDLKKTFDLLSLPHPCNLCWCGSTVEFNLLGRLRPRSIMMLWERFRDYF